MSNIGEFRRGLGYIPDKPDSRDYLFVARPEAVAALPPSALLNDQTPVEDQGNLGSCTGNAGDNVFKIRDFLVTGTYFNGSRLALYKWARDHDGSTGDAGSTLRSMAWVLANKGVPPESEWPYDISQYDVEPPDNVAQDAKKDEATKYYRVDGSAQQQTLTNIKTALSQGYPVMLGITAYDSIFKVGSDGNIPMPQRGERPAGGHAIAIVGYDDAHDNGDGTKGALKMKNSWGTTWAANGYGWLSYRYVLDLKEGGVQDCWVLAAESEFQGPTMQR
ncbi:MAG: C1 family peptidase [Halobacteriota archaeon]|jgi:C1A family cysteine protease